MNTFNRFLRVSIGLLSMTVIAAALYAPGALAQQRVSQYIMTKPTLTWTDISGSGTNFASLLRYYNSASISLPFAFNYDNTAKAAGTSIYIADGTVGIGTTYSYPTAVGSSSYPGAICFMASYGFEGSGDLGYNSYYLTTGTAPNRVFTIQMNGCHTYGWGADGVSNVQVKLFETSNVIQIIYQSHNKETGGDYPFTVGLNGYTSPSFVSLSAASSSANTPSTDFNFSPIPPQELSLQPKILNFGATTPQNPITMTVTAKSVGPTGSPALTITGYSLTGSSAYAITGTPPAIGSTIPAGGVTFQFTFLPLSSGSQVGTFTLTTNGIDSGTQVVTLNGTGLVPQVSYSASTMFQGVHVELTDTSAVQYVRIASTGGAPLIVNSIYFYGLNASDYTIVHSPPTTMQPGALDSIGVRFVPDIEGLPDAHMVINTTGTNNPSDTVQMAGIGILPRLVLNNAYSNIVKLNFDSVKVGVDSCLMVNLVNPGSDTLVITKNFFSSADYDYTLTPLTGSADTLLPGGGSQQIQVCFMPLKPGVRQAVLRITTNIPHTYNVPQRDTSSFSVEITGVGVPYGHLAITGPALEDSTPVGIQKCTTLMDTLWNTGSSATTVTGAAITGTDSAEFTYSGLTFPVTLAPNTHVEFTVCGDPKVEGNNTAVFTAIDADNSASLPLGIFGTNLCDTLAWVTGFESATCMGTMDTATISVTNCGNIPTSYMASISGANASQFTIVSPNPSSSENAGGVATFKVAYTPDATDATSTATFNITGGPANSLPLVAARSSAVIAGSATAPTTPVGATSAPFPVTVNNTGACPWDPGVPTVVAPFAYVSGSAPIPANGSGTLMFTFTPSAPGPATAQTVGFPSAIGTSIPAANVILSGTGAASSVATVSAQNGYSIDQSYPNPSTGTSHVEITLPNAGIVHLAILDVTGNVVENVLDQQFNEGSYSIKIDASDLASGTYFYTMTSGGVTLTRQMTILK